MHVRLLHGDQVSLNPASVRHEHRKVGPDGKRTRRQRLRSSCHWGEAVGEGEGEAWPRKTSPPAGCPGKVEKQARLHRRPRLLSPEPRAVPPPAGQTGQTPPSSSLWVKETLTRPPSLKQNANLLLTGLKNSLVSTMGSGVRFYSCFIKPNTHLILLLSNSTSRNLSKRTENTCP